MKNYQEITETASLNKEFCQKSKKIALYSAYFSDFVDGLPTINQSLIAGLDGYSVENKVKISHKKINNQEVYFCGPLPKYSSIDDLHNFNDVVRLLKELGFENLLFLTDAQVVDSSIELNQPLIISDHINLTTFNPLIGKNDEKFGVRFPDMSEAYDPCQLKFLAERIRHAGYEDKKVIAAVLVQDKQPIDELTLSKSGISIIIHSVAAEVIVAVHCGLVCSALAFVPSDLDPQSSRQQIYNKLSVLDCWNL